jgi:hypothetical protein
MSAIMTSRQAAELDHAFERNDWTSADVKKLSEGNRLGLVLDYLNDNAEIVPTIKKKDLFLKKLTASGPLLLDAVDGNEILADANDVFSLIDGDFRNWDADEQGKTTEMTPVHVYEVVKDGTYQMLLGSLSSDFDKLCLSQAQIKNFVVKHRDWLRTDGYATFFAFKSKGKRFIAYVRFISDDGLDVNVRKFNSDSVWGAGHRHRFVLPQLAEAE